MINEIKNTQVALEVLGISRRLRLLEQGSGDRFISGGSSTGTGSITIEEEDGAPTGTVTTLKVTNGTLTDNGSGVFSLATGPTAPGGSDTQVQFNDSGAFGGSANFTFNKATNVLNLQAASLATAGTTRLASNGQLQDIYRLGINVTAPAFQYDQKQAGNGQFYQVTAASGATELKTFLGDGTSVGGGTVNVASVSADSATHYRLVLTALIVDGTASYSGTFKVEADFFYQTEIGVNRSDVNAHASMSGRSVNIAFSTGAIRANIVTASGDQYAYKLEVFETTGVAP